MPPRRGDSPRRSAVLAVLKRELWKHPAAIDVRYVPSSIEARVIRADLDPRRFPTDDEGIETATDDGPERTATLDVEWRPEAGNPDWFRIHYSDPGTGVDCGWHRDADHPELGPVHFQYREGDDDVDREPFEVGASAPPGILWECLDDLERVLQERR